jgi:N-acyl-D-amino-acid deacylase
MKKWIVGGIIVLFGAAWSRTARNGGPAEIRAAVQRSLPLLAKSSHSFLENAGCHSCHSQGLGMMVLGMAKSKGFTINEGALQEAMDSVTRDMNGQRFISAESTDPQGFIITGGYDMWGLSVNGYPVTKPILLMIRDLMERQTWQGNWIPTGLRPPLEYYPFSGTAMMILAMQKYAAAQWPEKVKLKTARAKDWLLRTTAKANEERAYQLLGLNWAGAGRNDMAPMAKALLAQQRPDGGWSQLDSLASDSYATGQSLYALNQTGFLSTGDQAYLRGLKFLLETQFEDGSWEVKSRTIPTIPYVSSGFPHGDNQFISAAGTSWAVMALVLAAKP